MTDKLHVQLETRDRKEQEKRVETLLMLAREETSVITIVVRGGVANFGIVGRPEPQVLLRALDVVRDDILVAIAKQEVQQSQEEGLQPKDDQQTPSAEELENLQAEKLLAYSGVDLGEPSDPE